MGELAEQFSAVMPHLSRAAIPRLLEHLHHGAPSRASRPLPGMELDNSISLIENGAAFTDILATWIKKKIVAGPLTSPPLGFRANRVIGIVQKDKLRPVMDMSAPPGASYNDSMPKSATRKVSMGTAQSFSYLIREAGKTAIMSKYDMKDAYKLIPAAISDLRLQGFKWLGKYFCETQLVFGSKNAVADYDDLGMVILDLALVSSGLPASLTNRCLDDVPVIAPKHTGWVQNFSAAYEQICSELNITLADRCPHNDKAFVNQTKGTVLGIIFDIPEQLWYLPSDKVAKTLDIILQIFHKRKASFDDLEKLIGIINFVCGLFPFGLAFRQNLFQAMASAAVRSPKEVKLLPSLEDDLTFWARVTHAAGRGLPIAERPRLPRPTAIHFVSDAAGHDPGRPLTERIGVASVPWTNTPQGLPSIRIWWPESLLRATDSKGVAFGSKSTTLESIGLLLPALAYPKLLRNKDVVLHVDNLAVVHSWKRKYTANDIEASVLIRTLQTLSARIPCNFFVRHAPRRSSTVTTLADDLSRATTSPTGLHMVHISHRALTSWMLNPCIDWTLPNKLSDLSGVDRVRGRS